MKNPHALTFGAKTYDGSSNQTITAADLGAVTDISGKQDKLTFDGTYNASTNKVATQNTVAEAINSLKSLPGIREIREVVDCVKRIYTNIPNVVSQ